jgi:small-conductance mechanosensitive channel
MENLREWFLAFATIGGTLVTSTAARAMFRRLPESGPGRYLARLAPALGNIVLLFGLRVFVEVAPLSPKLALWLNDVVYIAGVLLVLAIVRNGCLLAIEWSAQRASQSATLQLGFIPLMRNVITIFVLFMGAIMILKHLGYDVMSLLAALGVGSLAVGLAAKDTLSNMISGFTLIIDRNLKPGDVVNLGGSAGTVEEIGLRSTRIRTGDGNTLIVPNTELVNTKILNLSMPSREAAVSTSFRVPYSAPFPRVKELSLAAAREVPQSVVARGVWANLSGIADGTQTVSVGFWVKDMDDQGSAISELNLRLVAALGREKIPLVGISPPSGPA